MSMQLVDLHGATGRRRHLSRRQDVLSEDRRVCDDVSMQSTIQGWLVYTTILPKRTLHG